MSEYNEEELQRPEDLLSRRRLAIKLAELCSETRSYSPVFLLDGKWGSGKTFVAQLLQEECADRNTEVFYIDSWRADYLGDPLSAIISSFTKELEERSKRQDLVARLKDGVARVARVAGPTLLNAVARAALGEKGAGKITDLASNSSDVIAAYLEKEASLEELRETLEEFAAEDGPVVVIIDELDRCVPTYAVQMLEVLAHIFRIPGFCFILSAYREELEKTVRHVYGVNFDAGYFLDRFVDFSVEVSSTVTQKEGFLGFHLSNIKRPEEVLLQNLLCAISANVDGLDLRSCKQFIRRV